jgi:hypothetical protein
MAQRRNIPFYLVIPKNPLYGREITNSWIQENLPSEMKVYKFASISKAVVPKREDIEFIEVNRTDDIGGSIENNRFKSANVLIR